MRERKYTLSCKKQGFTRLPRSRLCLNPTRRSRLKRSGLLERKGPVD
jgi:hypothetical protein